MKNLLCRALNIKEKQIINISPICGMTNQNFLVKVANGGGDNNYCLWLTSEKINKIICRKNEKINDSLVSKAGFSVKSVYFNDETGIKITKFLDHSITLNHQNIANKSLLVKIAQKLQDLHKSNLEFANEFNIFKSYDNYFALLKDKQLFYNYHEKTQNLINTFEKLRSYFRQESPAIVPCHNDLVPENILIRDNVYFIDWEYSGKNDPLFELSSFVLEGRLSEDLREFFLASYFQRKPSQKEKNHILFYNFCSDILWTLWCAVKKENGEFFEEYAKNRISRAYKLNKKIESLNVL